MSWKTLCPLITIIALHFGNVKMHRLILGAFCFLLVKSKQVIVVKTRLCVIPVIFHHISSVGHLFFFFFGRKRLRVKISGTTIPTGTKQEPLMQVPFTPSLLSGLSEQFADSTNKQASIVQHNQRMEIEVSRQIHSSVHSGERRRKGTHRERLPTSGDSQV